MIIYPPSTFLEFIDICFRASSNTQGNIGITTLQNGHFKVPKWPFECHFGRIGHNQNPKNQPKSHARDDCFVDREIYPNHKKNYEFYV